MDTERIERVRKAGPEFLVDKMLKDSFFSICPLNDTSIPHDDPAYMALKPFHCISWREIPDDLKKDIEGILRELMEEWCNK
jgi:hypothetical protein